MKARYEMNKLGQLSVAWSNDRRGKKGNFESSHFSFSKDSGIHDFTVNGVEVDFDDFLNSTYTRSIAEKYNLSKAGFEAAQMSVMKALAEMAVKHLTDELVKDQANMREMKNKLWDLKFENSRLNKKNSLI